MALYLSMISYLFVTTFTPGPNTMMVFYSTSKLGYRESHPIRYGIIIGFNLLLFGVGILSYFTLSFIPSLTDWMKVIGAGYMVYLSYHILRDKTAKKEQFLNTYKNGILMQLANVKVLLMFLTFFTVYAAEISTGFIGFISSSFIVTFIQLLAVYAWAFLGSKMQKIISRYNLTFRIAMALLLLQSAYHILF